MNTLYLCPHGAAKSVIANALKPAISARALVGVHSWNAGTDPDPELNAIAVDALASRGIEVQETPRLVTSADIRNADLVVSMGCAIGDLPAIPDRFIDWSDMPDASAMSSHSLRLSRRVSPPSSQRAAARQALRGVADAVSNNTPAFDTWAISSARTKPRSL